MKTKKAIAMQIIVVMLINLFLPYSVLLTKSYAAVTVPNPAAVITPLTDELESENVISFAIGITGDYLVYGTTFFLKFDTSKLTPAKYSNRNGYSEATDLKSMKPITGDWACSYNGDNNSYLFADTGEIRIQTADGNYNPSTDGIGASEDYDFTAVEDQYNGFFPVAILSFMVKDRVTLTTDDITKDLIKIVPDTYNSDYYTGFSVEYEDDGNTRFDDITHLKYDGFNESGERVISGISVETNPDKMTYDHNDSIDLTNGQLKVTYEEGEPDVISMTDNGVSCSHSKADVNNKTLTFTYEGKQTTLDITVNDPVDKLEIVKTMNNTEYPHDTSIDFSGLELKATTRSKQEITLDKDSEGLTISETKADVNSANFTQTNTGSPKRGTQKIEFSYGGQTVPTTIIVNDTIASVAVKTQPTKKVYKRGESLDLSTGNLEVTMASGDKTTVKLSDGSVTITGYDNTKTGAKQNLKASFGGIEASNTIDVEVYNYIKNIIFIPPSNTTPNYNTNLDLSDASITEEWADEVTKSDIAVLDSYISGYTKTKLETQTVKVTYPVTYTLSDGTTINDSFEKTFTVKVHNNVTGITIKAPTKPTYNHGEGLDLAGGTITVNYAYGPADSVTMTTTMITESDGISAVNMSPAVDDYEADKTLAKTLKITYEEDGVSQTQDYPITVINDIQEISVHSTNHKTNYNVNESLDITNLEILVKRAVGTDSVVPVTDITKVTGFKNDKNYTDLPLTITYTENGISQTCTYEVDVTDTVTGITVKTNPKTDYKYNEPLDITGGYITVTKGSGTSNIAMNAEGVTVTEEDGSEFDPTDLTPRNLKVSYGGKDATYPITVKDYVTGIKVTPASVTGSLNDTMANLITTNHIKYVVTYAKAGDKDAEDLVDTMVVGYSSTSKTPQNLKINYVDNDEDSFTYRETIKGDLSITLLNTVKTVSIDVPTTPSYIHGGSIDLSTGKINLVYADNTKGTLPLSDASITEVDGTTAVNMSPAESDYNDEHKYSKTVKITYTAPSGVSDTKNYTFDIINDVKQISVHSTNHKTNYNVKEPLDITNLQILVKRAVGTDSVVPVTDITKVTGFKNDKNYTDLPLTITYTENGISQTCTYEVDVTDAVTGITVKTNPKTDYKYNEPLDITGGYITVTKGSGTTNIAMNAEGVTVTEEDDTPFDPTDLTPRNLKVSYGGKDATYQITVKDYVTGIKVTPASVTGSLNDTMANLITTNHIKYVVTYAKAGDKDAEDLVDTMVVGYSSTSKIPQNLKVNYVDNDEDSFTNGDTIKGDISITLLNTVKTVSIDVPTTPSYIHRGSIDLSTGKINLVYADNTKGTLPLSDASITELDGTTAVNMSPAESDYNDEHKYSKTVKITYTAPSGVSDTKNYTFDIINDVKQISVHSTNHKTNYNVKEPLDITNLQILVKRAVGTDSVVPVTDITKVTGFKNDKNYTDLPLIITYTENGISQTCTYEVDVTDTVTGITVKTNPKTDYKYNEPLDITGGYITVTKGSGTTNIAMNAEGVTVTEEDDTPFDPTDLTSRNLKVSYGGKNATYPITVKDYVTDIEVIPSDIIGKYNDELADVITKNNVKYKVTYAKAGVQTAQDVTQSMISGTYVKTKLTKQKLKVTYTDNDENSFTNGKDFVKDLSITLKKAVSKIEITAPTDVTFNHGDSLTYGGGTIKVTYTDNTSENVTITDDMVKEQGGAAVDMSPEATEFRADYTLTKNLTISYTEDGVTQTKDYGITIINDIQSIKVHSTNHKNDYNLKESLDITNLEVLVTRAVGTPTVVSITNIANVTGFSSNVENPSLPLTVKYEENGITKTDTYNVKVENKVVKIEMETTPKQNYKYNEELEVLGGYITATYGNGPQRVAITSDMVTGYKKEQLGEQELTVTYKGKETKYKVNVKDYVKEIIVDPNNVTGIIGDTLENVISKNSIKYKVVYAKAGAKPEEALAMSMVVGNYDSTSSAAQTLDVIYTDTDESSFTKTNVFTKPLTITLQEKISSIEIETKPKDEYNYGESLDVSKGVLKVIKENGSTTIPMATAMVTEMDGKTFNSKKLGTRNLLVTYSGKTTTYEITVKDYIEDIIITKPDKLIYNIGDSLSLTGGQVSCKMASGATKDTVDLSDSEVQLSGFDSTEEGTCTIIVKYKGKTKTFGVTIQDPVNGIAINTLPDKLDYLYGDKLKLTGGTITVNKQSGPKVIDMSVTGVSVTGYDPKKLGTQTITITYQGFTDSFSVNVEDFVSKLNVKAPQKTEYEYGEEKLSLEKGSASIVMASGAIKETVDLSETTITGFNPKQAGKQTIKVKYKDLEGSFTINITDKIKGIIVKTYPNKVNYNKGDKIDLTGATIDVIKSSGIVNILVTKDMISGYDPSKIGSQTIDITYGGFNANFVVKVVEATKNNTNNKTTKNTKTTKSTNSKKTQELVEEPIDEPVEVNKAEEEPPKEEKKTETLGVRDEKKEDDIDIRIIAGIIGGTGLLLLLIIAAARRYNVKIYVEQDGKYVLAGVDRISRKDPVVDVDKYLNVNEYSSRVKIYLSKSIAHKLDEEDIEIIHREKVLSQRIMYRNEIYKIIIE